MKILITSSRFVQPQHHACTRGPVIFIRPEHRNDAGLLAHEKVHVRQWWRTLGLHSFLYLFSKAYKLRAEVEAYKVQAKYAKGHDPMPTYAHFIATKYNLNITEEEALALLRA